MKYLSSGEHAYTVTDFNSMRQVNLCFQIEMHAKKSISYLIFHRGDLLKICSVRQRELTTQLFTDDSGVRKAGQRVFVLS